MNRLFYALLLTAVFSSTSTNTHAEVVHQLAGMDTAGNAVIIEYTKNKHWEVVFEGLLDHCSIEASDQSNRPVPNTFHQPLGNGQFAFACPNGYVIVAENGKPAVPIELPTRKWRWIGTETRYPVYLLFSRVFNNTFEKKWLFVAQGRYLFIIDLDTRDLFYENNWSGYFGLGSFGLGYFAFFRSFGLGYSFLEAGRNETIDSLDIYKDKLGTFNLLASMELPIGIVPRSAHCFAALPLRDGTPGNAWRYITLPSISEEPKDILEYYSIKFKCDANRLPFESKTFLAFNAYNWPAQLPDPPALSSLTGTTIQPQLDHYHSYIAFERSPDNTDHTIRKRTTENAFSREDL